MLKPWLAFPTKELCLEQSSPKKGTEVGPIFNALKNQLNLELAVSARHTRACLGGGIFGGLVPVVVSPK